ncbi:putative cyclin-A3-1 [Nymphaea colorata]|nr:putative cyclin-A3-1 [Nymphaea colorata]XP_031483451.1 putative cyclin-A3-1 [Nymphaea colorata]XP_049933442.1 putative cyclin-A3-1 [Nymphaea colorata]
MDRKNIIFFEAQETTGRITRARVAAICAANAAIPLRESCVKQEKELHRYSKRVGLDENHHAPSIVKVQNKRQAVLKDISNIACKTSFINCIEEAKSKKPKSCKNVKLNTRIKESSVAPAHDEEVADCQEQARQKKLQTDDLAIIEHEKVKKVPEHTSKDVVSTDKGDAINTEDMHKGEILTGIHFVDIDVDHKDPKMCSLYASEIYAYLQQAELKKRPLKDYMNVVQWDISPAMRAILVDWLVEVCEEYRLVPDTLFLTVCYIDRFLSGKPVERKMLQLVGITCMLIASKYEEICSPRVEDFCLITDNTYNKQQVLKMEADVLNHLHFELATPTTKTFLRRFLRAAQASSKMDRIYELEFLANYLAELTLLDYDFLKFVPSLVAASALFLAKWTLDQLSHPWNPTLEHYTYYKASDLKDVVFEIHRLQFDVKDVAGNVSLKAIREKYSQQKFKSVAALPFPKPLEELFQ